MHSVVVVSSFDRSISINTTFTKVFHVTWCNCVTPLAIRLKHDKIITVAYKVPQGSEMRSLVIYQLLSYFGNPVRLPQNPARGNQDYPQMGFYCHVADRNKCQFDVWMQ